jgi:hypothetical protein
LMSDVWGGTVAACAGPRLLLILRRNSRLIANVENITDVASKLGYCVKAISFESLSSRDQFVAARYADVMLGMHGAALTYLYMMDPTGSCRTVVELLPWVDGRKVQHNAEFGKLCNITVEQVDANGVAFGPSVTNKKQQKRFLRQAHKNIHQLSGFNDQTAFHSLSRIRDALVNAKHRLGACI